MRPVGVLGSASSNLSAITLEGTNSAPGGVWEPSPPTGVLGTDYSTLGSSLVLSVGGPGAQSWSVSASTSFSVAQAPVGWVPGVKNVSAASAITVGWVAAEVNIGNKPVSAATSFIVSQTAAEADGHAYMVSATTSLGITSSSTKFAIGNKPVSATTSFVVGWFAAGSIPGHLPVSALTVIYVNARYAYTQAPRLVSASNSFSLWGHDLGSYKSPICVSASSGVIFDYEADELATGDKPVSAVTSIEIIAPGSLSGYIHRVSASSSLIVSTAWDTKNALWGVSAATSFEVGPGYFQPLAFVASGRSLYVVARTGVVLTTVATEATYSTIKFASARTSLTMSWGASEAADFIEGAANSLSVAGAASIFGKFILVSAASGITLSTPVARNGDWCVSAGSRVSLYQNYLLSYGASYPVYASSGISLGLSAGETRNAVVSATTSLIVSGSGSEVRDIHASATTTVGLSESMTRNKLIGASATGAVHFSVSASAGITGTLAHTTLTMVTLARATVVLPWRRVSLSLPPGGGLPHS